MTKARVFSIDEANSLLPELDNRLMRLIKKKESYAQHHDRLLMHELLAQAEHSSGSDTDYLTDFEEEARALETSIQGLEKDLSEIRSLGCILRNIEKGWVDFLGRWKEELVYFCWRRGEESIQYYHPLKGGMTERRKLSQAVL